MPGGVKMNTWHVRAAALAAAVITTLAGCSTAHRDAGLTALSRPGDRNVTVAAIPSADLAGLYIAQNDGLFARQGLHVTIKTIASTKAVIASQLNGQVDIGAGSYVAYVAAQAAGARFRILAEASTLRPHTRVLLTTAGSRITTLAGLAGKKIAVNGTNSIGTLLISVLLAENGISPAKVRFVTDKQGFPDMAGQLQRGQWDAAFLAEPYASEAEEDYGQVELADLDQGAALNFPIGGYVATRAWAQQHPRTAAAFVRAIEEGQALAENNPSAARAAMGKSDHLPPEVTAVMSLPDFPVGPVNSERMQRTADAMLQFGILAQQYAGEVRSGTLIRAMIPPS
jgi:NitT/TauT family transport system substrate-binding protein